MQRSLYVVLSEQSIGLSTGQGGRATAERPFAAGHLQDVIGHGDEVWRKITNVSSYFFHLTFGKEQLQTPVSIFYTCFDKARTQILLDTIRRRLSI